MRQIILVLGYGKSTQAATEVLKRQYDAADIYLFDEMMKDDTVLPVWINRVKSIEEVPVNQVLFCLKSPGISYAKPYVTYLLDHQVELVTDVEVFFKETPGNVIAITGTNGKTTVTTLIGDILKTQYDDVRVCGNIGIPIAEVVQGADEKTIFVVEVSSFQLKGTRTFRPDVSLILNIADAHLDYHETESDYLESKAQIVANQDELDVVVYNGDDPKVVKLIERAKAEKIAVGIKGNADVQITETEITFQKHRFSQENIHIPGVHNQFNVAFAVAIGYLCGVKEENMTRAISHFAGVKHRLQYVGDIEQISIYNDSKSTNEYAAITALHAFSKKTVWICGGYDRGIPYTEMNEADLSAVSHMVIYGMMKQTFVEIAERYHISYSVVEAFEDVLKEAMKYAKHKDVILFSPGAASFDLFTNFEQRGEAFLQLVMNFKK